MAWTPPLLIFFSQVDGETLTVLLPSESPWPVSWFEESRLRNW